MLKIGLLVLAVQLVVVKDSCAAQQEDFIIAKGEQREIPVSGLKNFSVGNKEVVSTHLLPGKILIKGKSLGYSDLVIWGKGGEKQIQVYVLSKAAFLKTIQLAETLKNLGLTLELKGPLMVVSGAITSIQTWTYLQKLKTLHQDKVVFQAEAAPELRREMAAEVYRDLFSAGLTRVNCQFRMMELECFHEGSMDQQNELLKSLTIRFGVKFIPRISRWSRQNLRLKMKLIQIESLDGREISFGLQALKANVGDLFEHGLKKLIYDNQVALAENHVNLSTLAEPETIIQVGKPHQIEIGAQIPFQNTTQGQGVILAPIDWRFAGLKITSLVQEKDGALILEYETEFTRPADRGISGSKEKSSIIVRPGISYKMFQIGYLSEGVEKAHLPGLQNIPILRTLFGASSTQKAFKRIEGYLLLETED